MGIHNRIDHFLTAFTIMEGDPLPGGVRRGEDCKIVQNCNYKDYN